MVIKEDELKELMQPKADIEKISTLSWDGNNLLTRIPKDIKQELGLEKGNKLRWLVKVKENEITLKLEDGKTKEEKTN